MSNPSRAAALRLNALTSGGEYCAPPQAFPHTPHTPCRNGPDFTAQPPTKVSARHSSRHAPVICAVKYVCHYGSSHQPISTNLLRPADSRQPTQANVLKPAYFHQPTSSNLLPLTYFRLPPPTKLLPSHFRRRALCSTNLFPPPRATPNQLNCAAPNRAPPNCFNHAPPKRFNCAPQNHCNRAPPNCFNRCGGTDRMGDVLCLYVCGCRADLLMLLLLLVCRTWSLSCRPVATERRST
eukprot:361223-Chlamydomonas_euryale.AAC.5